MAGWVVFDTVTVLAKRVTPGLIIKAPPRDERCGTEATVTPGRWGMVTEITRDPNFPKVITISAHYGVGVMSFQVAEWSPIMVGGEWPENMTGGEWERGHEMFDPGPGGS